MRRRTLMVACGLWAALAAGAATGQSVKAPRRIAFLMPSTRKFSEPQFAAFRARLGELGHAEGREVVIDARWADGSSDRLSVLARELVALGPEILVAATIAGATAAKNATNAIPIVFIAVDNPDARGFVKSLARPGGNMTGVSWRGAAMGRKLVELVREAMPEKRRLAVLFLDDPTTTPPSVLEAWRDTYAKSGFESEFFAVKQAADFALAFEQIARWRAEILWVWQMPLMVSHAGEIAERAGRARLPVVGTRRAFTDAGGLLSYDNDLREDYRRAAVYVDRILKGAKPADLPVELPDRFHLSVNLRSAKNLGIRIPHTILLRADHVIE
jgi:putative ABC transport system substrate-binding protein